LADRATGCFCLTDYVDWCRLIVLADVVVLCLT